jgi:hypothetical protein
MLKKILGSQNWAFYANLSENYKEQTKLLNCDKIPIRAAQNKQKGQMRPAGSQFDMPVINC